jgi:hypothetical protein
MSLVCKFLCEKYNNQRQKPGTNLDIPESVSDESQELAATLD